MTREEEIRNKSYELGQRYFPDANNVWARANIEAQYVSSACMEIAQWADRTILDKACEWLAKHISPEEIYEYETDETPTTYLTVNIHDTMLDFINDFRKAMEGGAE